MWKQASINHECEKHQNHECENHLNHDYKKYWNHESDECVKKKN